MHIIDPWPGWQQSWQPVAILAKRAGCCRHMCSREEAEFWVDDRAFLAWSEGMGASVIANELKVDLRAAKAQLAMNAQTSLQTLLEKD